MVVHCQIVQFHVLFRPQTCLSCNLPRSGAWRSAKDVPFRPAYVNAALQLRLVGEVLTTAIRITGLEACIVSDVDVDVVEYGVSMPMGGLIMGSASGLLEKARQRLASSAKMRPVRDGGPRSSYLS